MTPEVDQISALLKQKSLKQNVLFKVILETSSFATKQH